ncbi:MAG TPA: hypothetical protein VK789_17375 [Bryobacteraceae bacterium]|jgi:hypothetical protein|nr:hypothetical protein [Bryobacteraceae bacterium]
MVQTLFENLPWVVGWLAFFSFLAVYVWSRERRREREALYRSEAIRKIAEMGGDVSEPVLQLLREAMAAWKNEPSPANMGPMQAREYYRNQTLQRIAEASGAGAEAALALLREEQGSQARRTRMGLKLGGAICLTGGVLLTIVLRQIVPPGPPVYLSGLIPSGVGAVLLAFAFFNAASD